MVPRPPAQLFAATDDEDGDDDGGRFDVRPQFEGPAGLKVSQGRPSFAREPRLADACPLPACVCAPADGAAVALRDR